MKNGFDEEGVKSGAITYFGSLRGEDEPEDVIKVYLNSKDDKIKRYGILELIKQRDSYISKFARAIEELNKTGSSPELEALERQGEAILEEAKKKKALGNAVALLDDEKEEVKDEDNKEEKAKDDGSEKEIDARVDSSNAENNELAKEDEQELEIQVQSMKDKVRELEEAEEMINSSASDVMKTKNRLMLESGDTLLDARIEYEQAQDDMALRVAENMVRKNILVEKRRIALIEIARSVNRGEDPTPYQNEAISLDEQIDNLDAKFEITFKTLRENVSAAHDKLIGEKKEVSKKFEKDFRNSFRRTLNYSNDGVLESETLDLNKNLKRVVLTTIYNTSVVADRKLPSAISEETININGQIIRILSQDSIEGANMTFLSGNTTQLRASVGAHYQASSRDNEGDLIAAKTNVEDTLDAMQIESIDDIKEACEEIEKKAKEKEIDGYDDEMEIAPEKDPTLNDSNY